MRAFTRPGEVPAVLRGKEEELGMNFAERRSADSRSRFYWPIRSGERIDVLLRADLEKLTAGHCSYCDGWPLRDSERTPAIDHFEPKSKTPELAFTWTNLYITCNHCNSWKGEKWNVLLLRPDEPGYEFDRYFIYNPVSGHLESNPAAQPRDQQRAALTLEIFRFNEGNKPQMRVFWRKQWQSESSRMPDNGPYRMTVE